MAHSVLFFRRQLGEVFPPSATNTSHSRTRPPAGAYAIFPGTLPAPLTLFHLGISGKWRNKPGGSFFLRYILYVFQKLLHLFSVGGADRHSGRNTLLALRLRHPPSGRNRRRSRPYRSNQGRLCLNIGVLLKGSARFPPHLSKSTPACFAVKPRSAPLKCAPFHPFLNYGRHDKLHGKPPLYSFYVHASSSFSDGCIAKKKFFVHVSAFAFLFFRFDSSSARRFFVPLIRVKFFHFCFSAFSARKNALNIFSQFPASRLAPARTERWRNPRVKGLKIVDLLPTPINFTGTFKSS